MEPVDQWLRACILSSTHDILARDLTGTGSEELAGCKKVMPGSSIAQRLTTEDNRRTSF